mgnify:CR=1 FL=1
MNKISIIIQAGGKSIRMGKNKALIPFLGEPLIQRVINRVKPIAGEMFIIANQPDIYSFLGLPILPDLVIDKGSLGGLFTAMKIARMPYVASVACDMPFVNPILFEYELKLIEQYSFDVVIPKSTKGYEPFHAVYKKETCLPLIEHALESDDLRLVSWFSQVNVKTLFDIEIRRFDSEDKSFININTQEDLSSAEKMTERDL